MGLFILFRDFYNKNYILKNFEKKVFFFSKFYKQREKNFAKFIIPSRSANRLTRSEIMNEKCQIFLPNYESYMGQSSSIFDQNWKLEN